MSSKEMGSSKPLRILITDDSPMYRRIIREILGQYPDVEVVGVAFDGVNCLELVEELQPNVITLDINMPRRDGLSTLEELRKRGSRAYVVMVSTPTSQSADQTLYALRKGALDMILKPTGTSLAANRKSLEEQLAKQIETIRCLLHSEKGRQARRMAQIPASGNSLSNVALGSSTTLGRPSELPRSTTQTSGLHRASGQNPFGSQFDANAPARMPTNLGAYDVLCIGVSTGGPSALSSFLPQLPARIQVPILVVQHMPPLFTKSLAEHLNELCKFGVREANDGDVVEPGNAYIAPGGRQMRLRKQGTQSFVELTDDGYVSAAKPSVDYLFQSVANIYGRRTLAMILTGMGSDGLNGCRKLLPLGARILAQSEETCVVYGMPRQVIENRVASEVVPLPSMASRVIELLRL